MKKTAQDVIISGARAAYYAIVEPLMLSNARLLYEKEYRQKDRPLISVYCPTYNRGRLFMERAVKSVLSQTYENFEFIIVGDCCTDNTGELVAGIADKRIRFYNLPQKSSGYPLTAEGRWLAGPVKAANQALELVRGKWIARIDDDDVWTKNHLESLLGFAQEGQYEFVSALHEEERRGQRKVVDGEPADGPYYRGKKKFAEAHGPKIGCTQTWFYRSYLRFMRYNIDCWRKNWNRVNDADLSVRIFKAGVRMGFLEEVLAFIYPRPGENTVGLEAYREAESLGYKVHN
ncbi:MAG: glycosyltransferase family 2 protein [Candidatus Niyogibacteria bacterium]|nr:glycosyltransferase family 2 protein [Candidatus Niyogibacteria bacterium]